MSQSLTSVAIVSALEGRESTYTCANHASLQRFKICLARYRNTRCLARGGRVETFKGEAILKSSKGAKNNMLETLTKLRMISFQTSKIQVGEKTLWVSKCADLCSLQFPAVVPACRTCLRLRCRRWHSISAASHAHLRVHRPSPPHASPISRTSSTTFHNRSNDTGPRFP